mmetsp:Transcript_16826/g.18748  ORF Transcript_16826/g.18748 Transcript_16826/m.18748 type:complete len:299 (-) Transcript_16826:55-951(-)
MTEANEILKRGNARKEKLEKSQFKQQALPSWRPNPTFLTTLVTFIIFGAIFLSLGFLLWFWGNRISEFEITYHDKCKGQVAPHTCKLNFELDEKVKSPIFVYYQVNNLYQNHRRYVRSRNDLQLRGDSISVNDLTDCHPILKNSDLDRTHSFSGRLLDPDAPAWPCGLIAQSFFNDTFELRNLDVSHDFDINPNNIAWNTDVDYMFKNGPGNWEQYQWMDVEDERFITWMRVAGMTNFRKPYGIIHEDLPKGKYELEIENNYPVSSFSGEKKFFYSTTNSYGGRNRFLAVCYLVVGGL